MSYYKATSTTNRRDNLISFRASTEDRLKAEELKDAMKLTSTSAMFRQLLEDKAKELGVA